MLNKKKTVDQLIKATKIFKTENSHMCCIEEVIIVDSDTKLI